ncbi:hypothetical protein DPMN_126810 [Dreissena polymorpha]|uniref:Uncharacterized protein n=1 Tax=Dreissena polymorpha TaxID=45954 RepID=A0A9D4GXR8_DREPO|nr:hypothetical protein DPMN_126810 [Dreissena polymorpha]
MNSLRAAPLSSGFLFGGKIQEALTADKDDQLHASLARNNSEKRQGVLKRPASRPPAGPVVKKDKRTNLFSKKPSWNLLSGSNRSTPSNRPSFSQRSSVRNSAKRTNLSLIRGIPNLLSAGAGLLLISPRKQPFLPPSPLMPEIPVRARLLYFQIDGFK